MNNPVLNQGLYYYRQGMPAEYLFRQITDRYAGDLFRHAFRLSGDRHVAEDLVQETFLRAWKSFDTLRNPKAAKWWLMTILQRVNARWYRAYRPSESDIPLDTLPARDRAYDTSIEAFVLRQAMRKLPEDYRTPLLLQVIGGYSQKEIARHLGISAGGVGTRLHRARNKLREMVGGGRLN